MLLFSIIVILIMIIVGIRMYAMEMPINKNLKWSEKSSDILLGSCFRFRFSYI